MNKKIKFPSFSDKFKIITLIGMMGSGKTKFGSFLSKKLGYQFYDIDNVIEKKFQISISKIFEQYGEIHFRNEEKKTIDLVINEILSHNKNSILSLGGGGFDSLQTQKLLLSNSFIVWLNCPIDILIKRIGNGEKRPMLKNDVKGTLSNLLKKRTLSYNKAHLTLNSSELTFRKMTNEILQNI